MKVLLTYTGPENTIKVDFPIIPDYDSRIMLSSADYKKMVKIVYDQFKEFSLDIGATKKEKEMAVQMYIENATVQHIDIVWNEEEQAYLPLILMSQPMNDIEEDLEDEDFMDDDLDETPQQKNHPHGKKRNLFN